MGVRRSAEGVTTKSASSAVSDAFGSTAPCRERRLGARISNPIGPNSTVVAERDRPSGEGDRVSCCVDVVPVAAANSFLDCFEEEGFEPAAGCCGVGGLETRDSNRFFKSAKPDKPCD
jgi:hypothetical protein